VADLQELAQAAVEAATSGEQVEAFAQDSRKTEVKARGGEVEGLEFSESSGVGVRVIREGRMGYAWVSDPSREEVASAVETARENATFATQDEFNALPLRSEVPQAMPELFREALDGASTADKVAIALELERLATSRDARVTKLEEAQYGDSISRVALASTEGPSLTYSRTDCWVAAVTLAEADGETQVGFDFRLGHEPGELDVEACAAEAVDRASRLLGATKPATAKVPVILDPHSASSFLGVVSEALTAEAVQKGRSLFAEAMGEAVASSAFSVVDDGRLLEGPGAAPFDDEGVASGRTRLIAGGVLEAFLHNTYTARRGGVSSTGNASRGSYKGSPGVSPSNLFVEAGTDDLAALLSQAEGGVLIQDVSGIHSGTNPISGEFSVGATGLRIRAGAMAEPLREMTIASTVPEMLKAVVACGSDFRFFSSVGSPSVLIGEMTVAGV
jgi:PmbA protein